MKTLRVELPEPDFSCGDQTCGERAFTEDQMRAYGEACAKAEREACAALADEIQYGPYDLAGGEIGEAIRARSLTHNGGA